MAGVIHALALFYFIVFIYFWCPDWESNLRPFALRDDTQPTEPHQSGPGLILAIPGLAGCWAELL